MLDRRTFCTLLGVAFWPLPTLLGGANEEREIKRIEVQSSNLASIGYDASRRTLEVEFRHGGIYQYRDVPAEVFAALLKADSKGRYFTRLIRGKYRFVRLTPAAR